MSQRRDRHKALVYHSKPNPGKIKVVPTKSHQSQRDLSLAYSPGVAYPCLEINQNPDEVYKYTSKSTAPNACFQIEQGYCPYVISSK